MATRSLILKALVLKDENWAIHQNVRLCVPNIQELRYEVLPGAHYSKFTIRPGVSKMYKDMMRMYWWKRMKNGEKDFD